MKTSSKCDQRFLRDTRTGKQTKIVVDSAFLQFYNSVIKKLIQSGRTR